MHRGIITISTKLSLTSRSDSRHHFLGLSTYGTESLAHRQNDRANAVIVRVKARVLRGNAHGLPLWLSHAPRTGGDARPYLTIYGIKGYRLHSTG